MLQAHSLLWHYLWVGPNILLLGLALACWRLNLQKKFPVFVTFAFVVAVEQLTLYATDISPLVSGEQFWRIFWAGLLVESLVKFALIGEIFSCVFNKYAALAGLGRKVIRGVGIVLVLVATVAAAYAPVDNPHYAVISRAHILQQTVYMVECGLLITILLFASYFRLTWEHRTFGIALGLSVSACVHLADWALTASGALLEKRYALDFLNMAAYHVCVLIWFYYLLIPQKIATTSAAPLPESNLELWNRELERLLQQ
jgi:hypothetical protein